MYSTTEKEKQFLDKSKFFKTDSFKDLTERDLLEKQIFHLMNIEKSNERIKANMQFWFYIAIIGSIISFLFLINF